MSFQGGSLPKPLFAHFARKWFFIGMDQLMILQSTQMSEFFLAILTWIWFFTCTGKSLSEALLFAEHGENMLCTKIVLNVRNNFCIQHVLPRFELGIFMYWTCISMNNLSSYCGLVDAKIRASDKDLPVQGLIFTMFETLTCIFLLKLYIVFFRIYLK